jgi:MinD superfamily P-loop ATPase
MMRIAVASGKGGTGKTTVATNLAWLAARRGRSVAYLDCDVEEPNGHIFLRPAISDRRSVYEPIPQVDVQKCNGCGQCGEICQYSAIVCIGEKVLVYPDLCHACGGCARVCPEEAIAEFRHEVGAVESGRSGDVQFASGELHVGKARAVPVIRAVKSNAAAADLTILDAPPGTSCPVVEAVRGADFVVLVTEPTPFGLHDLKLAVEVMQVLGLPCGVVINRASLSGSGVREFCRQQGIPILGEIPDDRRIAEAYSQGRMICEALPEHRNTFNAILGAIEQRAVARAG